VACVDENGRARLLVDGAGVSLVPSVVLFDDDGPLVGDVARDGAVAIPERVVECVKRRIGDPAWRFAVGDREYSSVDVSALILAELKRIADAALGGTVRDAVITVPAYFHDAERKGTIAAAEQAGLNVLKILNEPTAAAIYYNSTDEKGAPLFLVYDLGGGTFDVTIMRRESAQAAETLCTRGNHFLGGKNWDDRLVDFVAGQFAAAHEQDPRLDLSALYDLFLRSERAKVALTDRERTTVSCQYGGKSQPVEITRDAFEAMTADLLRLTEDEVDQAIAEAKLDPSQVGLALLVGGSSKMPMVPAMMARKAAAVRMSPEPDHCVALGAALEAARLSPNTGLYKPAARPRLDAGKVSDRTPHGLGVIAVQGQGLVNATIIPKNTTIPCDLSRDDLATTYDGQASVTVHLVQGEDSDPLACVPLATYEFSGIPGRRAGDSRVRVTYRFDENNVVDVSAIDIQSNRSLDKQTQPLVDLFELRRQLEGTTGTRPRRVALLMDASGSMHSRMTEAKEACRQFIANTDFNSVEMGIVRFGDGGASVLHAMSNNARSLLDKVETLAPGGGTPMHAAVREGITLLAAGGNDVEKYIVLFTDGFPDDRNSAVLASGEAKRGGISVLCIGVGTADQNLLDELATTPGQVTFAASSAQMVASFGNVARLISGRRI
jgi:molecular chaperone DnaK (HSP70)/uncharacterized protein YegL